MMNLKSTDLESLDQNFLNHLERLEFSSLFSDGQRSDPR